MNISDRYPYEGPRTPYQSEWDATRELSRSIFFKASPSYQEAARRWPMALRPDAWENSLVMFHNGQPVSVINRLSRDLIVRGHKLRMGFIGGVCTHPDHRGKGLAGTVLEATYQRFRDEDADLVYISGSRSLYLRSGANHIGGFSHFVLKSDAQKSIEPKKLSLRKANSTDAELLLSLNGGEQTHLVRDLMDYGLVVQHEHCSGRSCIFNIIESDSGPVGYIAAGNPDYKDGIHRQNVIEFAGDRAAILSAFGGMLKELGVNGRLVIEIRSGEELAAQLSAIGAESTAGGTGGTVKALNFTRTMEKLRAYFGDQLGSAFPDSLEFAEGAERYVVAGKGGSLEIDGEANMLRTLLGAPPGKEIENVRFSGIMENARENCLPISIPSFTLNVI